jgi:hypothetical protein
VRSRYAIGVILVGALLAFPASAAAGQGGRVSTLAAQQCSQERGKIGKRAFRKRYGAKHTMRSCIKRTRPKVASALSAAAQECQQQLAQSGAEQFILDFAWDEDTVENAMSECLADTADQILNPDDWTEETEEEEE